MKFFIVEVLNNLTLEREYHQMDASNAQRAVDAVRDIIGDNENYDIINVFVETTAKWE